MSSIAYRGFTYNPPISISIIESSYNTIPPKRIEKL